MRPFRAEDDREDALSVDGVVTFNYLQQHPEGFDPPAVRSPVEEGDTGTTDPWGVADGWVGG